MKTAVDWLVDHLYLVIPYEERNFLEGLRKEALEKEKEQIMFSYHYGKTNGILNNKTSEQFYNQTYKNQTP